MEKAQMMQRLKERMREVPPLPDEEEFTTSDETISRYLKAFEWKYGDAEAGLLQTVEYRREYQPLRKDCDWCHKQPGFHSMRQVGHDESGRPVVYASFAQATAKKNTVEDVVAHVTYLIENAKATMGTGVSTWVFVIDCTGMTLSVCRPKMGLRVTSLLSSHYPERLGMVICVNHNPLFHAFWKAIKKFMAPATVSKMRLLRSEAKIKQTFSTFFSDDLATWLWDEITLNKSKTLSDSQKKFWSAPYNLTDHDPRGCPSYVRSYIEVFDPSHSNFVPGQKKLHCPHPNIAQAPGEACLSSQQTGTDNLETETLSDDDDDLAIDLQDNLVDSDLEDGSDSEAGTGTVRKVGDGTGSKDVLKTKNSSLPNGKTSGKPR